MDIKSIGNSVMQIDLKRNEQPAESAKPSGAKSPEVIPDGANNTPVPDIEPPVRTKAVFAVDEEKKITIQIIDEDGKVVKQIPPEEYREMVRKLKEAVESLYDKWA